MNESLKAATEYGKITSGLSNSLNTKIKMKLREKIQRTLKLSTAVEIFLSEVY